MDVVRLEDDHNKVGKRQADDIIIAYRLITRPRLYRCTVGRVSVRQEAAVPVLGLPWPGRVGTQHRAGAALRLRGGGLRRTHAPHALALCGRRRRARRAGGAAAEQLRARAARATRARLPHRAQRRRCSAHGARHHLSSAPAQSRMKRHLPRYLFQYDRRQLSHLRTARVCVANEH